MKKLLAIDDVEIMLDLVRLHLGSDYEVVAYQSPKDALKVSEQESFDLILLDIEMPEMSGIEVLACLKKQSKNMMTPVIMLTGKDDIQSIQACLTRGAAGYVAKPFNVVTIRNKVAEILSQF